MQHKRHTTMRDAFEDADVVGRPSKYRGSVVQMCIRALKNPKRYNVDTRQRKKLFADGPRPD